MTDAREATKRILVIAEETPDHPALIDVILRCARNAAADVLMITSGSRARLETSVTRLAAAGIRVRGRLGGADPLQDAADDLFAADEIVLATGPRSRWKSRVDRIRRRFSGPIFHVLVDPVPRPERHLLRPAALVPRLSERR